jgi:hypothetical protein
MMCFEPIGYLDVRCILFLLIASEMLMYFSCPFSTFITIGLELKLFNLISSSAAFEL